MSELTEQIAHLADTDVLRLAWWLFETECQDRGGELADASWQELAAASLTEDSQRLLGRHGIVPTDAPADVASAATAFRPFLSAYAEREPEKTGYTMRGLGMDAGRDDVAKFLTRFPPMLIFALVLLKPVDLIVKVNDDHGNKQVTVELKADAPPAEVAKQLAQLPKLLPGKGR